MKRFSNTRQKLVLNRSKKASSPVKLQPTKLNGLKLSTLHSNMAVRDCNALKPINSSIYSQENNGPLLLRCRSISCVGKDRPQSKPMPSLNKLYLNNQTQERNMTASSEVHLAALDFALTLKQRGLFSSQTSLYSIPSDALTDLIIEFGDKIKEQIERTAVVHSEDTFSSKPGSSLHLTTRMSESFLIENQFSLTVGGICRQLSYQGGVIDIRVEGETLQQRKYFQQTMEALDLRPEKQAIAFQCDKLKFLQEEIEQRTSSIRQLSGQIDSLLSKKKESEQALRLVEIGLAKRQEVLERVEQQVKDIEGFVYRQPNRILQQQAQGYKQRQQELFDLAFMMDQSSVESIASYVDECILIPSESFKLTLSTFSSHQPDEEGNLLISKRAIEAFRSSISAVYESTVAKLKSIIDAKFNKIRGFVSIMRRLASYTIGKREYLTEINKKMASVSVKVDQHLKSLRKSLPAQTESIDVLQQLADCMKSIYCQAEVFY